MLTADWSLTTKPHWVLPNLDEDGTWRKKLKSFQSKLKEENPKLQIFFIADFPGK